MEGWGWKVLTRQAMFVLRNNWEYLSNLFCSGKSLRTYSGSVSLSYSANNAFAPLCHLWPVRLYCNFPYYLINGVIFKNLPNKNVCFDFLYEFCLQYFSNLVRTERDIKMNNSLHVDRRIDGKMTQERTCRQWRQGIGKRVYWTETSER
jgi:hypothetical protein